MSLTRQQVLISNGFIGIDGIYDANPIVDLAKNRHLLTVISNFIYYGYMPSQDALEALNSLDNDALESWWKGIDPALAAITADDRKMDDFVVYQNFPNEVLSMSEAEYWFKQILMYFGFDKELFREEPVERAPLFENTKLKVLQLSGERTLSAIFNSLLENKARWSQPQIEQMIFLLEDLSVDTFTMASVSFRENGIQVINSLIDSSREVKISIEDATDVLRLAAIRSDADVSLRQKVKFKNFSRRIRRLLCSLLEASKNLEADIAERADLWKIFLRGLHPGDFKFSRLRKAYDDLYNGRLNSLASKVESAIASKDQEIFKLLGSRPGEFVRRFHHLYGVFGDQAAESLSEAMPRLTTHQILKMDGYLRTINDRKKLVYPPRGNWNRLQVVDNKKTSIDQSSIDMLRGHASDIIRGRLTGIAPDGFSVSKKMGLVKLQTNDQELANYGRGTVFLIPEEMAFLRTASYWENKQVGVTWFDNGWNFFDENWNSIGVVSWDRTHVMGDAAIFSGDPVNVKDLKGRACQMIDLYIDRLIDKGVRYAVWNILCYSGVPFSQATGEVLGTLQWGENPEKGKLYEPSRAQMVFPIKGENLTKYIAYVDLVERKLVYMDANLKGSTRSAGLNCILLTEQMPAFVEYLESLPSIADLFSHAEGSIPVIYDDVDHKLVDDQLAYVFNPVNEASSFNQLDLAKFL